MTAFNKLTQRAKDTASFVTKGVFNLTHNGFALLGLAVVFTVLGLLAQPELRQTGEMQLMEWLQARQAEAVGMEIEVDATDRATATNPNNLPKSQATLAFWLSKKYRVAPEPVSALVAEAFEVSKHARLEPTLILAVMAIESGFNPFAQSPVGAQGLMQVMTSVHTDKYESFGGKLAAFDPVANLRVGVKVLQDCIARAGSLEGGLKQYVGASSGDDGGYAIKVLQENQRLQQVIAGRLVPTSNPIAVAPVTTVKQIVPKPTELLVEKVAALNTSVE